MKFKKSDFNTSFIILNVISMNVASLFLRSYEPVNGLITSYPLESIMLALIWFAAVVIMMRVAIERGRLLKSNVLHSAIFISMSFTSIYICMTSF